MTEPTMGEATRASTRPEPGPGGAESAPAREWLVTNGLGGYASGTVAGVPTRRYHGLLVAALPAPLGRAVMLGPVWEELEVPSVGAVRLGGLTLEGSARAAGTEYAGEFRLEAGLPVWQYRVGGFRLEKRILLAYRQNTVYLGFRLLEGAGAVRVAFRPAVNFRPLEAPVSRPPGGPYTVTCTGDRFSVALGPDFPALRLFVHGDNKDFSGRAGVIRQVYYRTEDARGYDAVGDLWTPGAFAADLTAGREVTLLASTEDWETALALSPEEVREEDRGRRRRLLAAAHPELRGGDAAQLVYAADQFLFMPTGRVQEAARARAAGDEVCSAVAGYHWFLDWGRDTMISLEGLTLCTGRQVEAAHILRTFSHCVRDGLIPNFFPDGQNQGLYHTADATLWFFHALHRYVEATGDRLTLRGLLPQLRDIVGHHLRGTRFNIRIDPADGLLAQGAPDLPLTWMDAKVGDWVVTPRRGKAVEINALWYNALKLLEGWVREEEGEAAARPLGEHAERCRQSFNERFWYAEGGYLYDVVEGDDGDDPSCRPNQVLAVSLPHPALDSARWERVLAVVHERLLTPVGLRSLAPGHPDYKPKYFGDLRSRDAAYHQGTVWPWLVGPFIDAWLKVHPGDRAGARRFLDGFIPHLDEACIGSISEIFDAEPPHTPRGTIAQAWSVAEVLRCLVKTAGDERTAPA